MNDNKMKERAYKEFQNKHKASIIVSPIVVLFAVIIMIIMVCNGIKDTKIYLLLALAILIGIGAFCYSLYVLKKSKEEDNK